MVRASIAGGVFLLAMSLAAQQQDNTSAPPQQQSQSSAADSKNQDSKNQDKKNQDQKKPDQPNQDQKKPDQPKKPSAAAQNPFPEAQSEKAADQDQPKDDSAPAQNEPAAPQPAANGQQRKPSAAEDNPFPESESEKAAHQAEPQPSPAPAPNSGKHSDQDYSSSQTKVKGMDLGGDNDSRIADGAGGTILSPELGRKDTKVGEFYLHSGDYKGAYGRFVEATKVDPGNAQAVFDLAEAARHLNNRPEAVRNYQLYLSAVPDGPHSKDARKALKDLGVQPNS